ncbi:MAG: hypothetical protein MJE77_09145 [Proteobacteria bacterium]|nr:hypothetical protein [Pseudomonadota bacterium]
MSAWQPTAVCYYRTWLRLGSGATYTVNSTVIGETTAKLDDWNWYQGSGVPDPGSVWVSNGWQPFDTHKNSALAIAGKYYYKIELADRSIDPTLSAYLNSGSSPSTVHFYSY